MKVLKNGDVVLENVRIIFPSIAEKDSSEYGRGRYHLTIVEPKSSEQVKQLREEIQRIVNDNKLNIREQKYYPVKDGDRKYRDKAEIIEMDMSLDKEKKEEKLSKLEAYKDTFLMKVSSTNPPKVVNKYKQVLDPKDILFNGALVNVHFALWGYKTPGHGVALLLKNILVLEEGRPSYGDIDAEDAFDLYFEEAPAADPNDPNALPF
jgi:hypothetical protein